MDVDLTSEKKEVEEALRMLFGGYSQLDTRVPMTQKPFRGTRRAFVKLDKERAWKHLR